MSQIVSKIKGDRALWAVVALMAIYSFLPVYSASSNLVYVVGKGTTLGYLVKHGLMLFLGFAIIYGVHKIPYHYFKGLSIIAMMAVIPLLIYTLFQGTVIEGANASRWIRIPFVGMTFQTSTLASVVLMVYVARYLSKIEDKKIRFKESLLPLWLPVFVIVVLILPANFSTAAILFVMVLSLTFLGGYPFKYLVLVVGSAVVFLTLFVLLAKSFPDAFPNRVDTWMHRVDSFFDDEPTEADYQIERAKTAIAIGGVVNFAPGKSVMKHLLPQSSSDFIYAIIVEEYGLLGGVFLMLLYLFLLFRIVVIANKGDTVFGKLLVIGVGLPIVFQALINMAVAVELFPVTGQTLPLISSGGTSVWMTCLAIGIILSVSKKREEIIEKQEKEENPLAILSETL